VEGGDRVIVGERGGDGGKKKNAGDGVGVVLMGGDRMRG
jgi:hypothetical protein